MPLSSSATTSGILTCVALATGLLIATPTQATDVTLRLQGQSVNSSANALGLRDDFGSGPGAYLGAEFHLNDRFGIELGVGWFELEETERRQGFFVSSELEASLTAMPVTVALNIHLTPQKSYDFYVAPKIGWAFFDDVRLSTVVDIEGFPVPGFPTLPTFPGSSEVFVFDFPVEDQFIFGLRLGFDLPLGDSDWSFSSSVDYTDMALEFEFSPRAELGIDPLAVGAGIGYSF